MAEIKESNSIAYPLPMKHEYKDTFKRVISIPSYNLVGCLVEYIIYDKQHGTELANLNTVTGEILSTDLATGVIYILWQDAQAIIKSGKIYWYKLRITFTDGFRKSIFEEKLTIK